MSFCRMIRVVLSAFLALKLSAEEVAFVSVCSAGNPNLLGKYVRDTKNGAYIEYCTAGLIVIVSC